MSFCKWLTSLCMAAKYPEVQAVQTLGSSHLFNCTLVKKRNSTHQLHHVKSTKELQCSILHVDVQSVFHTAVMLLVQVSVCHREDVASSVLFDIIGDNLILVLLYYITHQYVSCPEQIYIYLCINLSNWKLHMINFYYHSPVCSGRSVVWSPTACWNVLGRYKDAIQVQTIYYLSHLTFQMHVQSFWHTGKTALKSASWYFSEERCRGPRRKWLVIV